MANEYGTIEPGENPARMVDVPLSTNGEDRVRRGVRTIMEAQITPDEAIQAFEDEVVKGTSPTTQGRTRPPWRRPP